MSNAKQSKLQDIKIPNPNMKNLLKKLRNKIAFDFFSPNTKPFHYHHSPFRVVIIAFFKLFFISSCYQNLFNSFDLLLLIHVDYSML